MDEMKLAFEVLYTWIFLGSFVVLMAFGFYLFLELWETDRKNLLILMVVIIGGALTGIILAVVQ